jgi:1-acyl-sn-glycerol-3-phosphate acyltransferase
MNMFTVAAPAIKLLFDRVGRPEVHDRPDILLHRGKGAVIVCNHAGWVDSLWISYAVYPRSLRHMSKRELFSSPFSSWLLGQCGSISINRRDVAPSSIKEAIELLRNGELLLIFPAGTREESALFKRGAATIALRAQVPIVPAYYDGPKEMLLAHLVERPRIQVTFGAALSTTGMETGRSSAVALTERLEASIAALKAAAHVRQAAA